MFSNLSDKFSNIFKKLTSYGLLKEEDVNIALREIRIALLEADVSLPVVKEFIAHVKEKALGTEIIKSVNPGHMVIKLVQDELTNILGQYNSALNLKASSPVVIMMSGLQGAGKTTSCAKLALIIKEKHQKKVLLSSLDVYRPAAQKQLEILAQKNNIEVVEIVDKETPLNITKRTLERARKEGFDVVILDTAGRTHIDEILMDELVQIEKISNPVESFLVIDSMIGQDAANVASSFKEKLNITGLILTRIDGDNRGGAALSVTKITNCPIKYVGIGEKITEMEEFHPDRIAARIVGKGDIVSLVEKAASIVDEEEASRMAKKMRSGNFDMNDMLSQLKTMKKMGGISSMIGMIPGLSKHKEKLDGMNLQDNVFKKQEAIILSMTKKERKFPKIINPSRKKRISVGSGATIQEINILLRQHLQMQKMMKKMGNLDKNSLLKGGLSGIKQIFG